MRGRTEEGGEGQCGGELRRFGGMRGAAVMTSAGLILTSEPRRHVLRRADGVDWTSYCLAWNSMIAPEGCRREAQESALRYPGGGQGERVRYSSNFSCKPGKSEQHVDFDKRKWEIVCSCCSENHLLRLSLLPVVSCLLLPPFTARRARTAPPSRLLRLLLRRAWTSGATRWRSPRRASPRTRRRRRWPGSPRPTRSSP